MDALQMITGHASKQLQKFRQIGTSAGHVTANFYAFIPVGANATLTTLLDKAAGGGPHDASGYGTGTWCQNNYYPGQFIGIRVASGEVIIYFGEQ